MLTASVERRLEDINKVLKSLRCNVDVTVRKYMDDESPDVDTAIILIDDTREYAAYATKISTAMSTYLCGLQHGLQLVAGNYPFKALTAQARNGGRQSILRTTPQRKPPTRMNPRICPRFAFQRTKYREG